MNGTDSPESLEEFLCLGREITKRFGGPIVVSRPSPHFPPFSLLFQALSFKNIPNGRSTGTSPSTFQA